MAHKIKPELADLLERGGYKSAALAQEGLKREANVSVQHESIDDTFFQALLSRRDRRIGRILWEAVASGESCKRLVKNDDRFIATGLPPLSCYLGKRLQREFLPWDIIDADVSRELLAGEAAKAWEEIGKGVQIFSEKLSRN